MDATERTSRRRGRVRPRARGSPSTRPCSRSASSSPARSTSRRVLELALEKAEEVCRAETSSIWELDEERRSCSSASCAAGPRARSATCGCRWGEGIVGSVARSGQAEVVNDVAADPRWRGDAARGVPDPRHPHRAARRPRRGRSACSSSSTRSAGTASPPTTCGAWSCSPASSPSRSQNARLYAGAAAAVPGDGDRARRGDREAATPTPAATCAGWSSYSVLLGAELGLAREELEDLWLAATLHDIGKIAVPDRSWASPRRSTPEEVEVMKRHTVDGAEIVCRAPRHAPRARRASAATTSGSTAGAIPTASLDDEIPLVAAHHRRRRHLRRHDHQPPLPRRPAAASGPPTRSPARRGTQFCPEVVAAFRALFDERPLRPRSGGGTGVASLVGSRVDLARSVDGLSIGRGLPPADAPPALTPSTARTATVPLDRRPDPAGARRRQRRRALRRLGLAPPRRAAPRRRRLVRP